jgi:hypothetical protein
MRITPHNFDCDNSIICPRSQGGKANKTMEVTMTTTASTGRSDCGVTCVQCGDLLIAPEWSEYVDLTGGGVVDAHCTISF